MTNKRKQPTSANGDAKHAAAKSANKPALASKQSRSPASQQQFARPMRKLDNDSDEEEQDEESARRDRQHMEQIDADADADANEDDAVDEDEDDSNVEEDAENAAEEEQLDGEEEEADQDAVPEEDVEMEDGDEDAADSAAVVESSEAPKPFEYDLPIQLVQATYSGVLYGLKSKQTLRELRQYDRKLHSKRGLEEEDLHEDEEEDEEAEEDQKQESASAAAASSAASTAMSTFNLLFTNAAHIGSVKSLAISADGKWMVSGGIDENIKIYKTAVMREFGQLHSHRGSVSALEFYGNSFLLSGGQEGDLCIWNTKSWQLLRHFSEAHTGTPGSMGGVSCLSVHPSGRVALSVGTTDRKVKLWDLMKGTLASERKLDFACTAVKWSVGGEHYAIVGEKRFEIYDTSSQLLRREEVSETKLLSVTWLSPKLVALGCEDKTIRVHLAKTGECVATLKAHEQRVRGLDYLSVPITRESHSKKKATFLASASTDGQTYLWDLTSLVEAYENEGNKKAEANLHAFHPLCQSSHADQRVTLLRILPHYTARKEDLELKKPVQTSAAIKKQQEVEAKKNQQQTSQPASNKPLSKAEREEARLRKSKALFEKAQRSHAAKQLAVQKAKRLLAKNAPGGEVEDAAEEQPKKKAKPTFEEAPQVDSDQEPALKPSKEDEDDEEEEEQPASKASKPSGFSSALPMFKPKLNDQRRKKKSAQKLQRDADRSRGQGQQKR